MSYIVVRDYSRTDKQYLLKVLSRNMVNLQSATDWADSMKKSDIRGAKTRRQKKHLEHTDYYVVQSVEENVEIKAERLMFQGHKISFSIDDLSTVCVSEKHNQNTGLTHIFEGRGRSMNEAFDDCRLKIWELEAVIPAGWLRLAPTDFVKTTDKKFNGYYWVTATDRNDLWNIKYLNYKTLFIRKV